MVDRKLLKQALSELVTLKDREGKPTHALCRLLYTSALEEWAGCLSVDPGKLNKLVQIREAISHDHHR